MNVATGTIRAASVVDRIRESGGRVVWAVVDSGISQRHVHFQRHRNLDLPDGLEHIDLTASPKRRPAPLRDVHGHGSWIAGIVAGEILQGDAKISTGLPLPSFLANTKRGRRGAAGPEDVRQISGVAPACRLLSVKVLGDDPQTEDATVVEALRRIQAVNDFGRTHRIHGVVLAIGGDFDPEAYPCGMSPICLEIDRLVRMGICVVVAAGNEGLSQPSEGQDGRQSALLGSIEDPGNAELAITVGSTHREIPETAGISYFSSKGPTRDGRRKPDLVAPGEKILCCHACESVKRTFPAATYRQVSGTTMAAAIVAGAAAALQSVYPQLIGRPLELKRILMDSATDLNRDPNFQGHGLLNLEAALALAQQRLTHTDLIDARPPKTISAPTAPESVHHAQAAMRPRPVRLMCSYAHADLTLWQELQEHLAGLKHQGLLETWYDQEIDAGQEWKKEIGDRLEASDVFILMISSHFLNSTYCWDIEMKRALQRHEGRTAVVIPVVVRPCDWETAPFAKLEAVPRKGKQPVTSFGDQHEGWNEVTKKIRAVVERLARPNEES